MSILLLVVEAAGITGATLAVTLARSAPEDVGDWWDRQDWLHRYVMGQVDEPVEQRGLTILPWSPADQDGGD